MPSDRQFASEVVIRLRDAGFTAYWAGGCVRDVMMGHKPSDYDVATSATPSEVRQLFGHRKTLMVGASFGVVIVLGPGPGRSQVEVATFRTDAQYSDGRRPDSVTFSSPEEDAQRRDFTINGMFYDPIGEQVIDYVGGREDIRAGVIRAIGDPHARFGEDKLRMLRAVRFAARFGFTIDPATRTAISQHASDLGVVSGERIAMELSKMLDSIHAEWAIRECYSLGLLSVMLPDLVASWDRYGPLALDLLKHVRCGHWIAGLASLHYPLLAGEAGGDLPLITKSQSEIAVRNEALQWTRGMKARLRLSNDIADAFLYALQVQSIFSLSPQLPWSQLQPWLVRSQVSVGLELFRARCAIDSDLNPALEIIESRLRLPVEELNPEPLISGDDLQSMGLKPGPSFKSILQSVRDRQLDRQLQSRAEAVAWIEQHTDQRST